MKICITDKNVITNKFNEFFINIGSNLASEIPLPNNNFDLYLPHIPTISAENSKMKKKLKDIFSMKHNKTKYYDNINVNAIKKICKELKTPLTCVFDLSLHTNFSW